MRAESCSVLAPRQLPGRRSRRRCFPRRDATAVWERGWRRLLPSMSGSCECGCGNSAFTESLTLLWAAQLHRAVPALGPGRKEQDEWGSSPPRSGSARGKSPSFPTEAMWPQERVLYHARRAPGRGNQKPGLGSWASRAWSRSDAPGAQLGQIASALPASGSSAVKRR